MDHKFDAKFKTIVSVIFSEKYYEMIDWVNANSYGLVDVRCYADSNIVDVAFADSDDALYFKIKYSDKIVKNYG